MSIAELTEATLGLLEENSTLSISLEVFTLAVTTVVWAGDSDSDVGESEQDNKAVAVGAGAVQERVVSKVATL